VFIDPIGREAQAQAECDLSFTHLYTFKINIHFIKFRSCDEKVVAGLVSSILSFIQHTTTTIHHHYHNNLLVPQEKPM